MSKHPILRVVLVALLVTASATIADVASAHRTSHPRTAHAAEPRGDTVTPIQHVVVIYQENVSFDHYFGTYPHASNSDGQQFVARPDTPTTNGLTSALLTSNPNSAQPQRLDSSATGAAGSPGGQLTCDQNHNYSSEQQAANGGQMNHFPESVGTASGKAPDGEPCNRNLVMDYYDGNTVTALWNYAQRFAMSDNSYSTVYGPSSPGAIALVSGDTGSVDMTHTVNNPSIATPTSPNADLTPDGLGGYSLTSDAQPYWDDCSTRDAVAMQGSNIGDLLNANHVSWGWFQGGERPSTSWTAALAATGNSGQSTADFRPDEFKTAGFQSQVPHSSNQGICDSVHPVGVALGGDGSQNWGYKDDYIPHHEPFDYYASTANPHHLTLSTDGSGRDTLAGLRTIGRDTQSYANGKPQFDTPNHQYDMSDWDQLVAAIEKGDLPPAALPAVSFLKAPGYEDGHAAYSDPADEQAFITREINALEKTPDWEHTAVVIAYDDSDGWYDHAFPGVQNPSLSPADNLTDTTFSGPTSGKCGSDPQPFMPLAGEQGRCGLGPRQPFLVISPFAAQNHIDHNVSDQASIPNFVEYNWRLPAISGSADQLLSGTDQSEGIPFDIAGLFDFSGRRAQRVLLDPGTGQPVHG
jgi:phospholipase C